MRTEALGCKDVAKNMPLKREKQSLIKDEAPIRVCVPRHSVGADVHKGFN